MRKCLRGYAKDKDGNLSLVGTMSIPHSKDKPCPRERKDKRDLVRRGATVSLRKKRWVSRVRLRASDALPMHRSGACSNLTPTFYPVRKYRFHGSDESAKASRKSRR